MILSSNEDSAVLDRKLHVFLHRPRVIAGHGHININNRENKGAEIIKAK